VDPDYRDIIRRSLEDDQAAHEALYDALSGKMYGVCLRYAGEESEARDILPLCACNDPQQPWLRGV
jgi:hypothetical protein